MSTRGDAVPWCAKPAFANGVASRCSAGSTNAAVLPVPVWAEPMTSRPASSSGIVCAWIGVGSV